MILYKLLVTIILFLILRKPILTKKISFERFLILLFVLGTLSLYYVFDLEISVPKGESSLEKRIRMKHNDKVQAIIQKEREILKKIQIKKAAIKNRRVEKKKSKLEKDLRESQQEVSGGFGGIPASNGKKIDAKSRRKKLSDIDTDDEDLGDEDDLDQATDDDENEGDDYEIEEDDDDDLIENPENEDEKGNKKVIQPTKNKKAPTKTSKSLFGRKIIDLKAEKGPTKGLYKLPDVMIVGTVRSGAGVIHDFLKGHPKITATSKDFFFFLDDIAYKKGLKWYQLKLPRVSKKSDKLLVDKNPSFFYADFLAERLKAMNPNLKIIVTVRDPVQRLISQYGHIKRFNTAEKVIQGKSFDKWILKDGKLYENLPYLRMGIYADFIEPWIREFTLDRIHFVDTTNLLTRPWTEMKKIAKFLKLDPDNFYKSSEYWTRDLTKTAGYYYCLQKNINDQDHDLLCSDKSRGLRVHQSVGPKSISLLRKFYSKHNKRFFEIINQEFDWEEA